MLSLVCQEALLRAAGPFQHVPQAFQETVLILLDGYLITMIFGSSVARTC
jgi:hypothetical protein